MNTHFDTISGNIPPEFLTETNNYLEQFLLFLKSFFGLTENDVEMNSVKNIYTETMLSNAEYKEHVTDSLNKISEYIQISVSGNDSGVSGNGITVSGNLPGIEFYDNITTYIEVSTKQNEETITYLKDIHSIITVFLIGIGLILGMLFASNFSRWWKHE